MKAYSTLRASMSLFPWPTCPEDVLAPIRRVFAAYFGSARNVFRSALGTLKIPIAGLEGASNESGIYPQLAWKVPAACFKGTRNVFPWIPVVCFADIRSKVLGRVSRVNHIRFQMWLRLGFGVV